MTTHLIRRCFVIAVFAATPAFAGSDQAGTTAANFLTIGSGAGILGRGGATLGLSGDVGISAWNPAALGWLSHTELMLSHAGLDQGTSQENLVVGGRIRGSQFCWGLTGLYQSEGPFEGRDASNQSTGSFGVSSTAFGAQFAYPIASRVSVGVGAKWVGERLADVQGSGFALDAGLQARAGMFGLGVALQNGLGTMKYDSQSFDLPTNVGVGVAMDNADLGLRVALDANFPNAYYTNVRGGVEWRWKEMVALRAGYRAELDAPSDDALSGPTFGMGAGVHGVWIDYGYLIPGNGGGQHRVGFTLRPGMLSSIGALGEPEPEPEKPAKAPKAPKVIPVKAKKTASETAPATGERVDWSGRTDASNAPAPVPVNPAPAAPASPAAPTTQQPTTPPPAAPREEERPRVVQEPPAQSAPPAPAPTPAPPKRPSTITVRNGDTLESIATTWRVTEAALMMMNDLTTQSRIRPGMVLKLPPVAPKR